MSTQTIRQRAALRRIVGRNEQTNDRAPWWLWAVLALSVVTVWTVLVSGLMP